MRVHYTMSHRMCYIEPMGVLNIRLDDDIDERLTREAEREQKTRSEVARAALLQYLEERERGIFRARIVRAAREIKAWEARAVAEEALPFDNEALGTSEPRAPYRAGKKGRRR
jgi:predicted transcriptional regulator